jgi:carboxyl-terminal processing protease
MKSLFQRRALAFLVALLAFGTLGFYSYTPDSSLYAISKSLQIFGEVFRQVALNYVDPTDAEKLITSATDGMLRNLDPYTNFIAEEDTDEMDIITEGSYGGLGIVVSTINDTLTIVGISEGYSADRAGVRVGDKLFALDTVETLKLNSADLRKYTRGKPGSKVVATILRPGKKTPLRLQLDRQEIQLKNVTYSGMLPNGIGYIKLERFSRQAGSEVRTALENFRKSEPQLRGVILDLRDNPGGLIDAAINICELFVPQNSVIVSTKARTQESERVYTSRRAPIEPDVPLAVMINDRSASASEIIAGAIQDVDRGVIVGENSFGKGLVQTILPLPYNATLKMTTAKYYTPSGRCIQKIDYDQRRKGIVAIGDTNKVFRTGKGRLVRQSSGIRPDTTVSVKYASAISDLLRGNHVFRFATEYATELDSLPANFTVSKQVIDRFFAYLQREKFVPQNSLAQRVQQWETLSNDARASQDVLKKLGELKQLASKEQYRELEKYRAELTDILHDEIYERFYPRSRVIASSLATDIQIQTAVTLLRNSTAYQALMSIKSEH